MDNKEMEKIIEAIHTQAIERHTHDAITVALAAYERGFYGSDSPMCPVKPQYLVLAAKAYQAGLEADGQKPRFMSSSEYFSDKDKK